LESVDPSEFVAKLIAAYQQEEEEEEDQVRQIDWVTIGQRALSFLRIAPAQDFMLVFVRRHVVLGHQPTYDEGLEL